MSSFLPMGRLKIDLQHRDFYASEGFIELEGLLQEKELALLHQSLKVLLLGLAFDPTLKVLASFRNLWKKDPLVKKHVLRDELAQLALDLTRQNTLRLGVDQLVTPALISFMHFDIATNIEDLFSIQDQAIGLILNLSMSPLDETIEGIECLPKLPGSGVFFKPKFPLELSSLSQIKDSLFLIVTYAYPKARYKFNDKDLFTHDVKKEGKAFGDPLSDADHPLVAKSSLQ